MFQDPLKSYTKNTSSIQNELAKILIQKSLTFYEIRYSRYIMWIEVSYPNFWFLSDSDAQKNVIFIKIRLSYSLIW